MVRQVVTPIRTILKINSQGQFISKAVIMRQRRLCNNSTRPLGVNRTNKRFTLTIRTNIQVNRHRVNTAVFFKSTTILIITRVTSVNFPSRRIATKSIQTTILLPTIQVNLHRIRSRTTTPIRANHTNPEVHHTVSNTIQRASRVIMMHTITSTITISLPNTNYTKNRFAKLRKLGNIVKHTKIRRTRNSTINHKHPSARHNTLNIKRHTRVTVLMSKVVET